MDNALIAFATLGLGIYLYLYVMPLILGVSESINSLPF